MRMTNANCAPPFTLQLITVPGAYIEVASLARRKGGGQVVGFGTMPFGGPMEDSLGRNNKKMTGRQELDDPRLSGDPQSASALDDDEDAARTGYIVSFFRVFPGMWLLPTGKQASTISVTYVQ